jgi:hypothetical protein
VSYPPDNADVVARLRLELARLATCSREECAITLIAIALDATRPAQWGAVLETAIERAIGYR